MAHGKPLMQHPRLSVWSNAVSKPGVQLIVASSLRPVKCFHHAEVPSWLQNHPIYDLPK